MEQNKEFQELNSCWNKITVKNRRGGVLEPLSKDEALTSSQVASKASQNWIADYLTIIDDKLFPWINYGSGA